MQKKQSSLHPRTVYPLVGPTIYWLLLDWLWRTIVYQSRRYDQLNTPVSVSFFLRNATSQILHQSNKKTSRKKGLVFMSSFVRSHWRYFGQILSFSHCGTEALTSEERERERAELFSWNNNNSTLHSVQCYFRGSFIDNFLDKHCCKSTLLMEERLTSACTITQNRWTLFH